MMLHQQFVLASLLSLLDLSSAGLLGAGSGDGSCAASPFRTEEADLAWPRGCPAWASCCTEYGYCHPRESWETKMFRDCNGESNGIELPEETLLAEAAASGDEEVIVFPDAKEEELEELSQQVVEEEALPGHHPTIILLK